MNFSLLSYARNGGLGVTIGWLLMNSNMTLFENRITVNRAQAPGRNLRSCEVS